MPARGGRRKRATVRNLSTQPPGMRYIAPWTARPAPCDALRRRPRRAARQPGRVPGRGGTSCLPHGRAGAGPSRGRAGRSAGGDDQARGLPRTAGDGMGTAVLEHPAPADHRPASPQQRAPPRYGFMGRDEDQREDPLEMLPDPGEDPARRHADGEAWSAPARRCANCRGASARPTCCANCRAWMSPKPPRRWVVPTVR